MINISSDIIHAIASPYTTGILGVVAGAVFTPVATDRDPRKFKAILGCIGLTCASIFFFKDLSPQIIFELTGSNFLETVWSLPETARYGVLGIIVVNLKWLLEKLPYITKNKGASK